MQRKHEKPNILPLALFITTVSAVILTSAPNSNAEDISPVDDEITITVDSACTMGNNVISSMTGINPGETKDISHYRIAAYCNDSNGYDIYAVGFTDGEQGNTRMRSVNGNTIPTGTSGEESYWNMILNPGTASGSAPHIPIIESPFTSNTDIPSDYAKVASYPSTTIPQGTDPTESGSYFDAVYQAHASLTQQAGTYTGQVQFVMVHPVGAEKPFVPYMQTISQWKDKLLPNVNDTVQAIDKRDGKKYWITKLADGNIWMTQNLDLDLDANTTYTSENTDLPNGSSWEPAESTYTDSSEPWGSYVEIQSYDPGERYWNGVIKYNGGSIESDTTPSGDAHYHIGNYYNWTAAIAMNNSSAYYRNMQEVNQSICPAGWRLPTYSGDKSFLNLVSSQGITSGQDGNAHTSPTYFVYNGAWFGGNNFIGNRGFYWSNTVASSVKSYRLGFFVDGVINPQASDGRDYGLSIRCVAR